MRGELLRFAFPLYRNRSIEVNNVNEVQAGMRECIHHRLLGQVWLWSTWASVHVAYRSMFITLLRVEA